MRYGSGGKLAWYASAVALVGACATARAENPTDGTDTGSPHFEVWSGAQAYRQVWSLYSGVSAAPFGSIQQDGARLRVVVGYGQDTYQSTAAGGTIVKFQGTTSFADALLGYHSQMGALTLKVFAGVASADRRIRPEDPAAAIQGTGVGGKAVLEGWWNVSDQVFAAIDLSWGSLYQTYSGRARLGWRFAPPASVGLELGAFSNAESSIGRVAAFLRYELADGEVAASGGFANDRLLDGGLGSRAMHGGTPFAMVSWLTRF